MFLPSGRRCIRKSVLSANVILPMIQARTVTYALKGTGCVTVLPINGKISGNIGWKISGFVIVVDIMANAPNPREGATSSGCAMKRSC